MRAIVVIIQKYVCKWLVLKFLSVTTSIQCCWRKMLAIREFWRPKQKANKVATNPIQDSRANLLEEGGNDMVQLCDTTQARSNLDFRVKFSTVQIYAIEHNSKSNRWIELKLYQKILEVFFYVRVNVQVNWSLKRTCDIGQNMLYEFCYLLPFDLWNFYLAKIIFLKGCGSLFWRFSSFTIIFNELKHNFQEWQWFINVLESFFFFIRISYSS